MSCRWPLEGRRYCDEEKAVTLATAQRLVDDGYVRKTLDVCVRHKDIAICIGFEEPTR